MKKHLYNLVVEIYFLNRDKTEGYIHLHRRHAPAYSRLPSCIELFFQVMDHHVTYEPLPKSECSEQLSSSLDENISRIILEVYSGKRKLPLRNPQIIRFGELKERPVLTKNSSRIVEKSRKGRVIYKPQGDI